jgi:hypothetical protein
LRFQVPAANNFYRFYSGSNLSLTVFEQGASTTINTPNTNLYLSAASNLRLDATNVFNVENVNQNYREKMDPSAYLCQLGTDVGPVSGTYLVQLANVVRIGRLVTIAISMTCNVTGYPGGSNEWRLNFPSAGFPQFYNQDNNWGPCTPDTNFQNNPVLPYYLQSTSGTQLRINQYRELSGVGYWTTPGISSPLQIKVKCSFTYIST